MKKIITAALLLTSLGISAQETYQNAELMTEDLNGTARYVGMGGAMDALGADLTTMGTNPAGVGLFRRSQAYISMGAASFRNGGGLSGADNKTVVSFDQAGCVITMPAASGNGNFLNIGFNYRKSSNFNQIISAVGNIGYNTSQNKVSFDKQDDGTVGTYMDKSSMIYTKGDAGSQVDYLYYNTLLPTIEGNDYFFDYNTAEDFLLDRDRKGYIGEYDINFSGNINDRLYLGLTIGIKDVHYTNSTIYTEGLVDYNNKYVGDVTLDDVRKITGQGANLKLGAIFRPVEDNPFRLGLSIASPTWYDLTTENSTYMYNDTGYGYTNVGCGEAYDYEITTPWQFGISAGTTVGKFLAIGAGYDFADYSTSKSRIKDGGYYDYWGDWVDRSSNDYAMNNHTDHNLKGVHTFKVGAEIRPIDAVAIRAGYNHVSPMFADNASRSLSIDSPGTYYSSTTDYTNWKATDRFTAGIGFQIEDFSVDVAYQYSTTKGDFLPFENYCNNNRVAATNFTNNRHQFLCTLGMKF